MRRIRSWALPAALALALVALTVAVYAPVRHFEFVQLDDPLYVVENPNVRGGLTLEGVAWAFSTGRAANWHPVTWLSHMLDVEWFGVDPGSHHVTNVAIHAANALLLFGLLVALTGARWRSLFVASLFAVHPLHVESVAWIAERKDVLSTLFWMLTIWSYAAYAARSTGSAARLRRVSGSAERHAGGSSAGRRVFYALTLVFFALGLMSKPMLVTLPFVLLLLDAWPLGRLRIGDDSPRQPATGARRPKGRTSGAPTAGARGWSDAWPLVREKLPLFALAAASSLVTIMVQESGGAVTAMAGDSIWLRIENAIVSTVLYLRDAFWPVDLSILYPYAAIPAWQVASAAAVIAGVSWLAFARRRTQPWLTVGWLWYLGTLAPVSGIIRVGLQSRADRYTYVPLVGVFIMAAWTLARVADRTPRIRPLAAGLALAAVLGCAFTARAQVLHWKDSAALWTHATMLSLHVDEFDAHMSLGTTLGNQDRLDEALQHFAAAVRLRPRSDAAHLNLGLALAKQGRKDEAAREFDEALRLNPDNETAARLRSGLRR
jgi:protein O-mannosyl-transferase